MVFGQRFQYSMVQITASNMTRDKEQRPPAEDPSYKMFTVAEVEPWLYLCGASLVTEERLTSLGITCLISASPELPPPPLTLQITSTVTVPIMDHPSSDISSYLHEVADTIEKVKHEGGKTLVHCVAGVSRSASLVLAYLVKYRHMTLRQAFDSLRSIRRCVRPNIGFFAALARFEESLYGRPSTVTIVETPLAPLPDVYLTEVLASRSLPRFIGTS